MDLFNNRETALALWGALLIIWLLIKSDFKLKITPLLKSFFNKHIIILFSIVILYVLATVIALNQLELWDTSQTKNTLIWIIAVALTATFDVSKNDKTPLFSHTLKSNLGFLALVEFLVNSQTFSLTTEFILFPVAAALTLVISHSAKTKKNINVKYLAENLLAILGVLMILWACFQLYKNYSNTINFNSLQAISTPALLSVCYFPFIFVLSFFFRYERFNVGLQYAIKDEELRLYIKPKAILKLHLNMTSLERWKNSLLLSEINSKESALNSIERMKSIIQKEKRNRYVAPTAGWQPQKAKNYLIEKGLTTGHYKSQDDAKWYAMSDLYEVGTGIMPNNVAYYIDGNSETATKLRVVMNINSSEMLEESYSKFIECIEALLWHALKEPLPFSLRKSIYNSENNTLHIKQKKISIVKENFPNRRNDGYRAEFSISTPVNADAD